VSARASAQASATARHARALARLTRETRRIRRGTFSSSFLATAVASRDSVFLRFKGA
jgi:hypothetical protein